MFTPSPGQQPIGDSVNWIADTLLGQLAVTLCVLAIAFVGFSMLTGRISVRRGGQVILGCFLLIGAPAIAASLMGLLGPSEQTDFTPSQTVVFEAEPREPLPPPEPGPPEPREFRGITTPEE